MTTTHAYPLCWPADWRRTPSANRKLANFSVKVRGNGWPTARNITIAEGVQRVLDELRRWGYTQRDIIISTNVPVKSDGLPRSDSKRPQDPGVAVYWDEPTGPRRCIAVDVYTTVEDNLAAVAATIEAMRAIERHGGAVVLERAFTGFTALPPPSTSSTPKRSWWEVLGVASDASRDEVRLAYRRLRSEHHPDRGGVRARYDEIEAAWEQAQRA